MEVALTKMSSKGQIVIPSELRKNFKEGEKLLIIKSDGKLLVEKVSELSEKLKEDLEFAKRTEKAWKRHDKGEFKRLSLEEFEKELDDW